MNAEQILNRVVDVYQNCSTYADAGEVEGDLGKLHFKTQFCRPNKFRFEWSKASAGSVHASVIFSESDARAAYFDGKTLENPGTLSHAIAGATGVSLGVAPLTAHLLMPNLFEAGQYQSLQSLKPYQLVGEDNSCLEIRADWRSQCWTTLFVDKSTPIIRRIEMGITPTLEEKKRGIEALEAMQAPEVEAVRALLLVEEKPKTCIVSYNEVKFNSPVSSELFLRV